MSDYTLVLAFDTDNPEFARGVEIGRLWERMNSTEEPFEATVHISNTEMILRMADAQGGRIVVSEEIDDIWMTISFGRAEDA